MFCSLTFTKELDENEEKYLSTIVKETIDTQACIDDDNTNPGYVLLLKKPDVDLYQKAVTKIVTLDVVQNILHNQQAMFEGYKNGRGLIGATAAISWEPLDRTFELIAYRPQQRWGAKRQIDLKSVQQMDTNCPNTFDNYDARNHHNRIVPNSPCPILYGIRGNDVDELVIASTQVKSEPIDSWLLFETNQGTDNHLQKKQIAQIQPFESVIIEGSVVVNPFTIQGGHVLFTIKDATGTISCAAYEPTKEFRNTIRGLHIGDFIEVYGGVREHPLTINLEKFEVKHLITQLVKTENPVCPSCNKHMKSKGTKQGYKCIRCGITSFTPIIQEQPRTIIKRFYEVPVCARRHLSKPLKRMNQETRSVTALYSENECIL
ncbi:tRNA(Ile2) 2-agmatinylcytidine synthetase TiaS [uncultured archaeon]|nr:tRNA(Ile2) 2-agmatinylcytidine synthetase TiaS [uncultured archaeon]